MPKLFESSSPAGKGALLFTPCAADLGRETTGSNSANAAAPEQPATEAVDPVAAGILAHTDTGSDACLPICLPTLPLTILNSLSLT